MKCAGCGIEIQSLDPQAPGYIPESIIIEKLDQNEKIICQRCFKIKHYNKILPVDINSDFLEKTKSEVKKYDNIIWIVDVIDFEGTFRPEICDMLKIKNTIIVINKIDLLPKSTSYAFLKEWLYKRIRKFINIPKENIRLISAKNNFGINSLKKIIRKNIDSKFLVMGVTNVGKSSVINNMLKHDFTVSSFPGTTLNTSRIHIDSLNVDIFDTPGIETKDRIYDFFDIYSQVKMIPSREISKKSFNVDPGRCFFISGLVHFKVNKYADNDMRPIFNIFTPEKIAVHETNEERIEDIKSNTNVIFPPYDKNFNFNSINFKTRNITIERNNDLFIPGLGWIAVKRGPLDISITYPEKVKLFIRPSMIIPK